MKYSILKRYVALLGLVTLLSACAGSPENSASSNNNSAQQANSNSQQPLAEGNATDASPSVAPPAAQSMPPPTSPVQPPATANVNAAIPPKAAAIAGGPKLIAPAKRLEFGKQPQDKTLIRAIVIKNGGRANLNVESVTPS